jgi:hypothetical protein
MDKTVTAATILSNAFDKDYTASQAVSDLEKLMNEATLLELSDAQDSPRYLELQKLIPVQERLVKTKMDGNPIFDRLGTLKVTPAED